MRFTDIIKTATSSLKRNKLRTALSLLGIVIGVFSVTLIVSMGFGLRAYVTDQVNSFGENLLSVQPSIPGASQRGTLGSQIDAQAASSLRPDDIEAIRAARLPYVVAVTGQKTGLEYVRRGSRELRTLILGASADYTRIDAQVKLAAGRFYDREDERGLTPVAVIGSAVAEKLFRQADPIGQRILVKGVQFEVIGVLERRGSVAFFDFDTVMFVPLEVVVKRIVGSDRLNEINLKLTDAAYFDQAIADLSRILRREHGIVDPAKDDFHIHTQTQILEQVGAVTGAVTVLLALLAAISLLVGGIGVMNIMLVSVTERIREIGLRKALGARDDDVRRQFLVESTLLTTVGGLAGGALGMAATFAAIALARRAGYAVPYVVSLPAFLAATIVSAGVGIIFGLKPARKAASLEPVAALRFE